MNQETEVKILEVDKEKIIESLKENNAEFIKNVFQKNFVYTNFNGSILSNAL